MKIILPDDDNIDWSQSSNGESEYIKFIINHNGSNFHAEIGLHNNLESNRSPEYHILGSLNQGLSIYDTHQSGFIPTSVDTAKNIVENSIKHFNKLDPESFTLSDMNEYIKDQVQQYQFAEGILVKTGLFDEDEYDEPHFEPNFYFNNDLIQVSAKKGYFENGNLYDIEMRVSIFKEQDKNDYGLAVDIEDKNTNYYCTVIGKTVDHARIPELKLNDSFYTQLRQDFETAAKCVIENKPFKIHHNINEYIENQNINKQIKTDNDSWFDTFPNNENLDYGLLQDMSDFIIDECSKENYSFEETETALACRYNTSEKGRTHIDAWVNSGKLKEFYDDLNTPTINTNNNRTNNLNPKELEKMGYVQGVAECVAALGDNHELGKKMLNEMKVTKEDILKYANPKTVNFLTQEDNILASKPEQKLEQTQGRGR